MLKHKNKYTNNPPSFRDVNLVVIDNGFESIKLKQNA